MPQAWTTTGIYVGLMLASLTSITAAPTYVLRESTTTLADPDYGPKPGFSSLYNTYHGIPPPFPANSTEPIPAQRIGNPAPNDILWQNLLSAEWIIFSFYQAGVETFDTSSFTDLGFPNTTYERIMEIRDNEAGHLRIFQDEISPTSLKPGACRYEFPFGNDPAEFLALSTLIEIASMAFLTGLVQQATTNSIRAALTAVSQVETRHEVWSLLEAWGTNPFSGPSDTVFPYANEVLDVTNQFVIPDSCPSINPEYPNPSQHLPALGVASDTLSITPGSMVQLNFTQANNQPRFDHGHQYYLVFYHGINVISVAVDTDKWPEDPVSVEIPRFDDKGVIIAVMARDEGAPTLDSVVAGPVLLLQQPSQLGLQVI